MIDVKALIEYCDGYIPQILTSLKVDYKFENDWVVMQCCFHGGDGYNLKYRDKNFYCFSQCRRNYTIVDVVMQLLGVSFIEALSWLCKELNIDSDEIVVDEEKVALKRNLKRLKRMKKNSNIVEYKPIEQSTLNNIEQYNHPYLLEQGFKPSTLEHFNIGFARGGEMTSRIVFPIDAPNGEIISLSGRLPNATQLGLPKYKILGNSYKTKTLYNISRINKEDNYVIVVEGFKSVMSLYEWGFNNVVATMGASLSAEQRNLLLSLGKKIIVIGDLDEAGKRLAQSVYNQCYRFAEIIQVDLGQFTKIEKSSPCESDLGFDDMCELVEYIRSVI